MENHNQIGIKKNVRQQVSQNLGFVLADTYVLYVKTQNFHWNMRDPRFYSLHLFLEKQYEELAEAADEIAERIRMLGERSPGSLKEFLKLTNLKESGEVLDGNEMLHILLLDHESMCRFIRERIDLFSDLGDEGSADLLIQRIRAHEKQAWMIRSHLEN
jgi:starvation-inducible DNA-binding protein